MIDEAAYISHELLIKTIIPVLAQSHTCLIAITTPRSSEHFFSALLKLVDPATGKPIFNVLRIGNPCDVCKQTDKPWLCTHKTDELPPWKSFRKQNKYASVYEGHEEDNIREQWGMEADSHSRAFNKHIVDRFKERLPVPVPKEPPLEVVMTSDPAGAGDSGFAIMAAYWEGGTMVVCIISFIYFRVNNFFHSFLFASTSQRKKIHHLKEDVGFLILFIKFFS